MHDEPGAGDTSGALEVVQDDRITGGWYVTCGPTERPTLVTAHLRGVDGPELFAKDAWAIDARAYKTRDEFGAAAVSATSMVLTPAATSRGRVRRRSSSTSRRSGSRWSNGAAR